MKTRLLMLVLAVAFPACGVDGDSFAQISEGDDVESLSGELRIRSQNQANTLDVGSWNVEWFGATDSGPADEALQQKNVARVIKSLNLDVVGLVEVVNEVDFHALLASMPLYDGVLVTDDSVEGGSSWYSTREQKVALLFKKKFTMQRARVVVTAAAYDFGGRPPLEVTLSFTEGRQAQQLTVVVTHFKAMANLDGFTRRTRASQALKTWLDACPPEDRVLVIGDFNDDIDRSTYQGQTSPLLNFVNDSAHYRFTTDALTVANESTTTGFRSTIDHHLANSVLAREFVEGSATVLHPETVIADYATSTSDHYPVMTRYRIR